MLFVVFHLFSCCIVFFTFPPFLLFLNFVTIFECILLFMIVIVVVYLGYLICTPFLLLYDLPFRSVLLVVGSLRLLVLWVHHYSYLGIRIVFLLFCLLFFASFLFIFVQVLCFCSFFHLSIWIRSFALLGIFLLVTCRFQLVGIYLCCYSLLLFVLIFTF